MILDARGLEVWNMSLSTRLFWPARTIGSSGLESMSNWLNPRMEVGYGITHGRQVSIFANTCQRQFFKRIQKDRALSNWIQ